jgi:chromosome partitioning protein
VKILATYNNKGGVGKTAAAVNLAYLAARGGARVLLWDLDPQGAATYYFRVRPKVKGGTKKLLKKGASASERIRGTDFYGLDLLPADFSYRHMDLVLDQARKPSRRLAKLLEPLAQVYDYIFLDCPPSISLTSEAVFGVADALLVPIIPTTLSLRTLEQIFRFRDEQGLGDVAVLPFFSLVDRRKRLHRETLEALPAERPELLRSGIPYAAAVERMGVRRQPLAAYARSSAPARAYEALWQEIVERLEP